jgi:hypothetical protein
MSDIELQAAFITTPNTGEVIVKAISATSITVDLVTELTAINPKLATALEGGRFVSIVSDGADMYYKFGSAGGTADRTAVTGNNRTFYAAAGTEKPYVVRKGFTFLDVQGSGAGYVRIYISSVAPHEQSV